MLPISVKRRNSLTAFVVAAAIAFSVIAPASGGLAWSQTHAPGASTKTSLEALPEGIEELTAAGKLIGAQVLIGRHREILIERYIGRVSPEQPQPVDADTMFCIGSTSKPIASAVVMGLVSEGLLELDRPIDYLLPQFGDLKVAGSNEPAPAPTLRQLLIHRGGVYSQKRELTQEQRRLIRDFRLTLAESVSGIAKQDLIAKPGEEYAYSGAGYCVIGRLAEVATNKDFEQLLQERIARPLGLKRTSYFPSPSGNNVAAGAKLGSNGKRADPATPHLLGADLKLPLIGGSIHSTARELARFSRMIINRGRFGATGVLPEDAWVEMTSRQAHAKLLGKPPNRMESDYGMGWSRLSSAGSDRPTWITHGGALASSRSRLLVNLRNGYYVILLYSTSAADRADDRQTRDTISKAIAEVRNVISSMP